MSNPTYKERIAAHLRTALIPGMTQAELASILGFNRHNVISMHLDPGNAIPAYPLKRLPALARHLGLSAEESLSLVNSRTIHHPNSATAIDQPTLTFILDCGIKTVNARASARAGATRGE
jgi:hypothetical protein